MTNIGSALLFWAITVGYLAVSIILVALLHRIDKLHRRTQHELAELQRQASTIQRSAFYLEGLARLAHGDVEEMAEMEKDAAGVFVER